MNLKWNAKVELLDVWVNQIDAPALISFIATTAKGSSQQPALINYVNVHAYYLSFSHTRFREVLNQSDVLFCDGFGVKLGARLLGLQLGARMTPPDWIDALFATCSKQNIAVYFLGDEAPVVAAFARKVQEQFPNLKVKGWHHGFFNKANNENEQVIEQINSSKAELVITGMGMPVQELWAYQNRPVLQAKVVLSTGALFRWYSGVEKRGPRFITDNGFEWLWRLLVQPKKVWRRYVVELPYFFWVVLKQRFKQ